MKIIKEMSLKELETWQGATDTKERIINNDKEVEFESLMEEMYPNGISEIELNDLLWFDDEWIYESLGIEIEE